MYALPLWSPWLEQDIQMPEKVQKKAVGMVPGLGGKIMKKNAENFMKIYTFQSKREKCKTFTNLLNHEQNWSTRSGNTVQTTEGSTYDRSSYAERARSAPTCHSEVETGCQKILLHG